MYVVIRAAVVKPGKALQLPLAEERDRLEWFQRQPHKLYDVGSNPTPATNSDVATLIRIQLTSI